MAYSDWYSVEEIYAGTSLRDESRKEDYAMALHGLEIDEAILDNRNALMKELNHSLERCVFPHEVHGTHIHKVTAKDLGKGAFQKNNAIAECDGLYTKEKNILLGIFTADCVPILIYDKGQHIICALHAGWKGTVNEITNKMLDILLIEENSDPQELYAYIGPCIDFFSYEVGEDVKEQVQKMSFATDRFMIDKGQGKYLLDLKRLNMEMMLRKGIPDLHIFMHHGDTVENNEDFFSNRLGDIGRNLTFILQK